MTAHLCPEAEAIVAGILEARSTALRDLLARCESPVEQQLLAALCDRLGGRISGDRKRLVAPVSGSHGLEVLVEPQRALITSTATYRADLFVAIVCAGAAEPREQHAPTCIEIDGYEFHSSKDAVIRDRRRDRDLVAEGIRVVRFPASEVFHDAAGCAREIEGLVVRAVRGIDAEMGGIPR